LAAYWRWRHRSRHLAHAQQYKTEVERYTALRKVAAAIRPEENAVSADSVVRSVVERIVNAVHAETLPIQQRLNAIELGALAQPTGAPDEHIDRATIQGRISSCLDAAAELRRLAADGMHMPSASGQAQVHSPGATTATSSTLS
jgi:hypothetical protein